MAIFIRADVELTNPRSDNPMVPPPLITSATFNTSDGPLPPATDSGLGGAQLPWVGNLSSVTVAGGKLRAAAAAGTTWSVGVAAPVADVLVEWTYVTRPVGTIYLDVRRGSGGSSDAIRGVVRSDNTLQLSKRVSGTTTGIETPVSIATGDRLGIRVAGSHAELLVNGAVVRTATITETTLQAAGLAGVAGYNDSAWALDDFTLSPA